MPGPISAPVRSAPRRPARRWSTLLVGLALLLTACTSTSGSDVATTTVGPVPADRLTTFINGLAVRDAGAAAAVTSAPGEAQNLLQSIFDNLNPTNLQVTAGEWTRTGPDSATVAVSYAWDLPKLGSWAYDDVWTWHQQGSGPSARWTIDWSPTVVHPKLGAGQSVAVRTTDTTGGSLVDRNNQPILGPVTVYSVLIQPKKVTDLPGTAAKVAAEVGRFDKTITAASIIAGVGKARAGAGYTVINLREADFQPVRAALAGLTGVSTPSEIRNLPPTRDFAKMLLEQVEPVADGMTQGQSGWRVVAIDATGEEATTLQEQPAQAGAKVTLTMDTTVQKAAEAALAKVTEPAVMVAIQPSTGEILAVAQNAAANAQGPIALTGRYPPGSTFKIVTATAAFDRALTTPTAQVQCPGSLTIDSRPIRNEYEFDLGQVTTTLAFAKSCNTTFARLASKMPADALTTAAKQYGVGIDFVVKGITTLTGKVPVADSVVESAEDGFGQGRVLVTPFSAALMAATAATGDMPVPTIIRGTRTTTDQPVPPRSAAAKAGIKTLMRAVVTDGTGLILGDLGTVYAKTGTAEFTDARGKLKAHAWTVGYRGDVAFATLIVGGDDSKRTNVVVHDFLAAVPAG